MSEAPKDDEDKFNETLKRMLKTPPKPHKPKPAEKDGSHGTKDTEGSRHGRGDAGSQRRSGA